eukprot:TRINITY_DN3336_c0_g1_i3.p1 TRINITY_DN3336_c0_g1~~TRINITY_DN3336_c0_g1_i3.p1  ORF type:complete len:3781 (+),score=899.34 TRINITY_DN3336_c0_g1_i3:54-11396(+)
MQQSAALSAFLTSALIASPANAVNLRFSTRGTGKALGRVAIHNAVGDYALSESGQNRSLALLSKHEGEQEPEGFPAPYAIDPMRCVSGRLHVGCVLDTQIEQQRWYSEIVPKEDQEPMTVEVCYRFCNNVTGVQYFGLKGGRDCYCTPFFHNTDKGANGECDQPCEGDNNEMCGGLNMIDIYEMHDCNNLPPMPCKKLPQVTKAKLFKSRYYRKSLVPCANTVNKPLTTADSLCSVECELGYVLSENTLKCTEKGDRLTYSWAQMEGSAECVPVNCGVPPDSAHTRHTNQAIVYPKNTTYTCQLGYEVAGAPNTRQATVSCTPSGKFSAEPYCDPVPCGECPTGEKYPHATPRQEGIRVYTQSCTYDCEHGYTLDRQASGGTTFDIKCLATKEFAEPATCKPVLCGPAKDHAYAKLVTPDEDTPLVFPEVAAYKCKDGFSLSGIYGGKMNYEVSCKANGLFSRAPDCLPVTCGPPPLVPNALYPKEEVRFRQAVTFLCSPGYTFTGKAFARNSKTVACGAEGQYMDSAPVCMPVECGEPPERDFASLETTGVQMMDFSLDPLLYKCSPGYSTDVEDNPWEPVSTQLSRTCKTDGKLSWAPLCVNINDCAVRDCGPNGACVDNPEPNGDPMEDFTCKCEPGYEITLYNSSRREGALAKQCTNINDCPDGKNEDRSEACGGYTDKDVRRGKCMDHVLGYTCVCGGGYKLAEVPGLPKNQTCVPVVCGKPPVVKHGKASTEEEQNFDSGKFSYTCDTGYTLDGKADGETKFEPFCDYNTAFNGIETCNPVSCGAPPEVSFSDRTPKQPEMFFPDVVSYTCEEGYTLDAFADGKASFDVSCESDGKRKGAQVCMPVKCGQVPADKFGQVDASKRLVYPQTMEVSCNEGYSTDGSTAEEVTSYTARCLADGTFGGLRKCEPVIAGVAPEVRFTTRDSTEKKVYLEKVVYTLDPGYSLDAKASGEKSFEIEALATGTFSPTKTPLPVQCGVPPEKAHTDNAQGIEYIFGEYALYTCLTGYSVDGKAKGADGCSGVIVRSSGKGRRGNRRVGRKTSKWEAKFGVGKYTLGDMRKKGAKNDEADEIEIPEGCEATLYQHGRYGGWSARFGPGVYSGTAAFKKAGAKSRDASSLQVRKRKASGPSTFTTDCQSDGKYQAHDPCKPNECGAVVVPKNMKQAEGPTEMVFTDVAKFKCLPGYSLDGLMTGPLEASTKCQATGKLTTHAGCLNMDDCEGNKCGAHGTCSDNKEPTGVHKDDYKCVCDSGFKEEIKDGKRICGNVPDCPPAACLPGACHDLVNDYRCECPEGYYEDANEAEKLKHDCLPNKCGKPTEVPHATPTTTGDVFFDSPPVEYTCEEGYTLDGAPGGDTTFTISCQANKQFTAAQTCKPVQCHEAPFVEAASVEGGFDKKWVYPETVPYTCAEGFTVDGTPAGAKKFDGKCEATGEFSGVEACLPVQCSGKNTEFGPNCTYDEMFADAMLFGDELPITCLPGHATNKDQHSEVLYKATCEQDGSVKVQDKRCTPIDCGAAPTVQHGTVTGSTRFGSAMTVKCNEGFSLDGSCCSKVSSEYKMRCQTTGHFTEVRECQRVKCGAPPRVEFTTAPLSGSKYEDQETYTCKDGYSLNGKASGLKTFKIVCQANATWSPISVPKPVECGAPPTVPHATVAAAALVFQQKAAYDCEVGYTTTGQAGGPTSFETTCEASGTYSRAEQCKPIDCGSVAAQEHAKQMPDASGSKLGSLKWGELAVFKCLPGFSTDGMLGSELLSYSVSCQATGELHYPAACLNMDDCISELNRCHPDGACVDNAEPTGVNLQDFQCQCRSGFREENVEGHRTCVNIPDCPEGACLPGHCVDLVNDYACECPEGYFVGEPAHECKKVSCGVPLSMKNSDLVTPGEQFFMDQAAYVCHEGYTVDGTPHGEVEIAVTCNAALEGLDHTKGVFEEGPVCEPVVCGVAPTVPFAYGSGSHFELYFDSEPESYLCEEGYSLGGGAHDPVEFVVSCSANGSFTGVEHCMPVRCPFQPADWDPSAVYDQGAAATMVFPDQVTVTCARGFALDKDKHDLLEYTAECGPSGHITFSSAFCKPIDCGEPPAVPHGVVEGSTRYGDSLKATADEGYSLDGTPQNASKSFNMRCLADGGFSGQGNVFIPIECDCPVAPHVETVEVNGDNIEGASLLSTSKKSRTLARAGDAPPVAKYGDIVSYTCQEGYRAVEVVPSLSAPIDADGFPIVKEVKAVEPPLYHMSCAAAGDLKPKSVGTQAIKSKEVMPLCEAVTCEVLEPKNETPEVPIIEVPVSPLLRKYQDVQPFMCKEGYSLDGKPEGAWFFEESCQADGKLSAEHKCKDIDWCLMSKCGNHGTCKDGLYDYKCICEDGWKADVLDGYLETCVQIDECDTMSGNGLCDGGGLDIGTCQDEVLGYKCTCKEGFENKAVDIAGLAGATKDSCSPVVCPVVKEVENAVSDMVGKKISFQKTATYLCLHGYTLDGTAGGAVEHTISCQADKTLTETKSCKPISCGATPDVEQAEKSGASLVYGESATYHCAEGHTINGQWSAPWTFNVSCTSDGSLTAALQCLPVNCGVPPMIHFATEHIADVFFPTSVEYTCHEGYTTTGRAESAKSFHIDCASNGAFIESHEAPAECKAYMEGEGCGWTAQKSCPGQPHGPNFEAEATDDGGMGYSCCCVLGLWSESVEDTRSNLTSQAESMRKCLPVTCGEPERILHAQLSPTVLHYPNQVQGECESGYTTTGNVEDPSTFVVSCESDGHIAGMVECVPVKCPAPEATAGAEPEGGAVAFKQSAKWNCKDGYSVDGTPTGPKSFQRMCQAHGEYGADAVADCIDIDFCVGNPCTANGVCTDSGVGVPAPGYSCSCYEGYEVKPAAHGGETCSADDCAGNPCREGGICFDLSKAGGEPGTYACECDEGYELVEDTQGHPHCRRTVCGVVPSHVNNTVLDGDISRVDIAAWINGEVPPHCLEVDCGWTREFSCPGQPEGTAGQKGEDQSPEYSCCCGEEIWKLSPKIDAFTGMPILRSFDSVSYTCEEGYSKDGSTTPGSEVVTLSCLGNGNFNRPMAPAHECQAVRCDNYALPSVPNAFVMSDTEHFFEYGDFVSFRCNEGHTMGGELGGQTDFEVPCRSDGTFPDVSHRCEPIKCHVPPANHATASLTGNVIYGTVVEYTCLDGYDVVEVETGLAVDGRGFVGFCGEEGELAFEGHFECQPVVCGALPAMSNAQLLAPEGASSLLQTSSGHAKALLAQLKSKKMAKNNCVGCWLIDRCIAAAENPTLTEEACSSGGGTWSLEPATAEPVTPAGWRRLEEGQKITYASPGIRVQCLPGHTVGGVRGGQSYFSVECKADGEFSTLDQVCSKPTFSVSGEVTDAQSAYTKLAGATVKFVDHDGNQVAQATTNSVGQYSLRLPEGVFTAKAKKTGYIDSEQAVSISGPVSVGQAADLAMSKVLPAGQWRVTLQWAEHSWDLDSWSYFGDGESTKVGWTALSRTDFHSGITATLDRDDTNGFGPETTTYENIGKCQPGNSCLLYFKVHNYNQNHDGTLGDSKAVVTVYKGNHVEGTFEIPKAVGAEIWHDVFTIDSTIGQEKLYPGHWSPPPALIMDMTGRADWSVSMDWSGWNKVPTTGLLFGLEYNDASALHHIEAGLYYDVMKDGNVISSDEMECASHDLATLANPSQPGLVECPAGFFARGLYRSNDKLSGETGWFSVSKLECCKPKALPPKWGACAEVAMTEPAHCLGALGDAPMALVGWHYMGPQEQFMVQSADGVMHESIEAAQTLKCCAFSTEA